MAIRKVVSFFFDRQRLLFKKSSLIPKPSPWLEQLEDRTLLSLQIVSPADPPFMGSPQTVVCLR